MASTNSGDGPNLERVLTTLEQAFVNTLDKATDQSMYRFVQTTTTTGAILTVQPQTAKQKVDQLNAEMMKKHKAHLRTRTVAVPF